MVHATPLILLALTLAACGEGSRYDPDRCPFVWMPEAKNAERQDGSVDDYQQSVNQKTCLINWSQRLARGPDNAATIAGAAVEACDDATLVLVRGRVGAGNVQAEDMRIARADATRLAILHVVAERAGHCSEK